MNTFYYIKNFKIEQVDTVKDKIYMQNFLKVTLYDSIEEVVIPNGYELDGLDVIPKIETLRLIKYNKIKSEFSDFKINGVNGGIKSKTLGINIQCSDEDLLNIQSTVSAIQVGSNFVNFYKGVSEIKENIKAEDFTCIYKELYEKRMEQWERKQKRYMKLKKAKTRKEIEEV